VQRLSTSERTTNSGWQDHMVYREVGKALEKFV